MCIDMDKEKEIFGRYLNGDISLLELNCLLTEFRASILIAEQNLKRTSKTQRESRE